jgi:hypothetical protein
VFIIEMGFNVRDMRPSYIARTADSYMQVSAKSKATRFATKAEAEAFIRTLTVYGFAPLSAVTYRNNRRRRIRRPS